MSMRIAVSTFLLAAALGAAPLGAHHSYASFDREHPVSIEGTLQKVQFVNPHVLLTVMTSEAVTYQVEWGTTAVLARGGVNPDSLKAGDHILVSGAPKRDPADHTVSLVSEVRRPADGWAWTPQQRPVN
jgi:Family of unknown function (DUF6152)